MAHIFKNGDIITDNISTGIVKEYDESNNTIKFWVYVVGDDNKVIKVDYVSKDIEYYKKATLRETVEVMNVLHREGYVWSEREGRVIDTYQVIPNNILKTFLIENCWYINDTTGECFLFKEYTSRENVIISAFALIDKDDFIRVDVNDFKVDGTWRSARKSEEIKLYERLSKVGYLWDEVTNQLVYVGKYETPIRKFSDGDFAVDETENIVYIIKGQDYFTVCDDKCYTAYYRLWASMELNKSESILIHNDNEKYSMHSTLRYATLPEINNFIKLLKDKGYVWYSKEKKLIYSTIQNK